MNEKGVHKMYTLTEGGKQVLTFINEPNLYRVIFRSNKQEAVKFQDWIFEKVIPQIRKTGSYSIQEQAQLPSANPYALTEQDERNLRMPLASYTCKLAGWLAKSKGVPKSQIELQLVEQFGQKHEPFFKQSKWFYSRTAEWLQEELDKLPVVDFGVSRSDLLNIFKRQCDYKQQFENWNDYQLQSWLNEQFFRNRSERYLGYPTSLESASYAQLTVLVDKMKHILGADFKLLDLSQQEKAAALPKLHGTDGSIGQALFNYGAKTPDKSELMWALQDMASLRRTFDELLVINWDSSQLNAEQLHKVQEANTVLNNLSTMLMEAAAETLKH